MLGSILMLAVCMTADKRSKIVILTESNFENEVEKSDVPVVVDFWAAWCGPCNMLTPTMEQIASEADDRWKVGKVNIEEQKQLAATYKISSIPALLFFKDGKVVDQMVGIQSKSAIVNKLEELKNE